MFALSRLLSIPENFPYTNFGNHVVSVDDSEGLISSKSSYTVGMANQGGSSRRSLSVTTASLHGKKKSMDIGERGPDTGRRSLTVSRSPL